MPVRIKNLCFNPCAVRVLNRIEEMVTQLDIDATLFVEPYVNLNERGFNIYFDSFEDRTPLRELPRVSFSKSRYSAPEKYMVLYHGTYFDFDKHGIPTEEVWERAKFFDTEEMAWYMILYKLLLNHPEMELEVIDQLDNIK
jgi:hypothetical protein